MALFDTIDPAELTGYAREIVNDLLANSPLTPLFPDDSVDGVAFSWTVDSDVDDVAEYRAFDAETTIGDSGAGEIKTSKLAPLGRKYFFGEEEQLSYMSPGSAKSVQQRADELAERAARAVVNRIELLRGEAIVTGQLAINENRFVQTVDFGRAAEQTDVAPAALWSAYGADPIQDLSDWIEAVVDESGVTPDYLAMGARAFRSLAAALAASSYITTNAGVVSATAVNDVLSAHQFPTVTVVNHRAGGRRVLSDDHIVLGATGMSGRTVWGTSVSAANPKYRLDGRRPGLVVGAYQSEDSDQKWVRSDALALAVLTNPKTTLSAKVL